MPIADFSRTFGHVRTEVVPDDVRTDVVYGIHCCLGDAVESCDFGPNRILVAENGPYWIRYSAEGGEVPHWRGPFCDQTAVAACLTRVEKMQAEKRGSRPAV